MLMEIKAEDRGDYYLIDLWNPKVTTGGQSVRMFLPKSIIESSVEDHEELRGKPYGEQLFHMKAFVDLAAQQGEYDVSMLCENAQRQVTKLGYRIDDLKAEIKALNKNQVAEPVG